jgi:hypothetical protein
MTVTISIIATLVFLLCAKAKGLELDWYIRWNMENLPFTATLLLYPQAEKLWRWLRFWLYA